MRSRATTAPQPPGDPRGTDADEGPVPLELRGVAVALEDKVEIHAGDGKAVLDDVGGALQILRIGFEDDLVSVNVSSRSSCLAMALGEELEAVSGSVSSKGLCM